VIKLCGELIQAGSTALVSAIHKFSNSIWNEEKLPKSIILSTHKKDDKIDCNNYHGISLISNSETVKNQIEERGHNFL
jgi:hypothetical protein